MNFKQEELANTSECGVKLKKRFDDAKVGDRVYSRIHGFGNIISFRDKYAYSMILCFDNFDTTRIYTYEGKCMSELIEVAESILFYVDGENRYLETRPVRRLCCNKVPIDTKVIIRDANGQCKRYYYAGGGCAVFADAGTSWSSSNKIIPSWCNLKLTEGGELELAEELIVNNVVYPVGTIIEPSTRPVSTAA